MVFRMNRISQIWGGLQIWCGGVAGHGGLTRCVSHLAFLQRLRLTLRNYPISGSLFCLEIEQAKIIKQRFGRPACEEVLKRCTELIARELPESALLGRLSNAEFAAYVQNCGEEQAKKIASSICESIAQQIFLLRGELLEISISVGIAYRATPVAPSALLMRAHSAMLSTKLQRPAGIVVWQDEGIARVRLMSQ